MESKGTSRSVFMANLMNGYRKIALGTVVSASFLLAACGEGEPSSEYQMHLERAKAYQEQGQYKAANIEYRNAVQKSQAQPDVVVDYADMMNELGNHRGAQANLESLAGNDSEEYLLELSETYIALGKYQSATKTLSQLTGNPRDKSLLQAELYAKLGKLQEANEEYSKLLATDANDGKALVGLATVNAVQGNAEAALTQLSKVDAESDAFAKSQLLKAGIEITQNQLELAEATLTDLLVGLPTTDQMLPDRVLTLERLSYVLTRLGRSNEAYIYTKLLAEAFPGVSEANERFQTALKDFQDSRMDEAKRQLEEILEEYPGHTRSRQVLGIISYMQGDAESAARYLDNVVDPETSNPLATQVLMATNLKLNEPKRVLEALESTIDQQASAELLALYGLAAVSDKQFKKGEEALLKAAELAPENARLQLALASFYNSAPNEDRSKSLPFLEKAFQVAPTQRQVLIDLAAYYTRAGLDDKAASTLTENAKKYPDNHTANYIAGQYLSSQNLLAEANIYLLKALQTAVGNADKAVVEGALGRNALLSNDAAGAKKYFSGMLVSAPNSTSAYVGIYEAELRLSGQAQALKSLEERAKANTSIAAYQTLMRVALASQNIAAAKRYYEEALTAFPDEGALLAEAKSVVEYSEALDYLKTGQLDKARDIATASLLVNPGNTRVVAVLAEVEIKSGNFDEAEKLLTQLAEQASRLGYILPALRGDLAFAKKDYVSARESYQQAWQVSKVSGVAEKLHRVLGLLNDAESRRAFLAEWYEADPDNLLAMLMMGMESQQGGDIEKATRIYMALLERRPDSVAALNNLGWIYFEEGNEEALNLLSKAAKLAPNSAAVLDSYGWVLHKFGKTSEGIPYLEKAAELKPDNQEILDHLNEAKNAG